MIDYLSLLSNWMDTPHTMLVILISVYMVAAMLDFLAGATSAIYTERIAFSSRRAQYGIIRKILTMAIMILVIPLALMFPMDVGVYALTILYMGITVTEIYSVLAHLGIVKENKKHENMVGEVFTEFIDRLLGRVREEDKDKK